MIRYALIAAVVVVGYLWYSSRRTAVVTRPGYVAPSPWAALGQLLGGAIAGGSSKPSADATYSRQGNQSPVQGYSQANWNAWSSDSSYFNLRSSLLNADGSSSSAGVPTTAGESFQLKSPLLSGDQDE